MKFWTRLTDCPKTREENYALRTEADELRYKLAQAHREVDAIRQGALAQERRADKATHLLEECYYFLQTAHAGHTMTWGTTHELFVRVAHFLTRRVE